MLPRAANLVELLDLEELDTDLYRARNPEQAFTPHLYGGQVAAQALRAAAETVPPGRHPHSLHGYFLSRGDASRRVLLTVSRDRDGGSYSNRRVIAVQNGVVIFNMAASFHVTEDGTDYQAHSAPEVQAPEDLPVLAVGARRRPRSAAPLPHCASTSRPRPSLHHQ